MMQLLVDAISIVVGTLATLLLALAFRVYHDVRAKLAARRRPNYARIAALERELFGQVLSRSPDDDPAAIAADPDNPQSPLYRRPDWPELVYRPYDGPAIVERWAAPQLRMTRRAQERLQTIMREYPHALDSLGVGFFLVDDSDSDEPPPAQSGDPWTLDPDLIGREEGGPA